MDSGVLRRPLPLAYHPLYRFYEGGALTRAFRGLPERPDDWWSEDWVGSCTCAGNPGPDGRPQGLSTVGLPGSGPVTLKSLAQAWILLDTPGDGAEAAYAGLGFVPGVRAGREPVRIVRCLGPEEAR